MRSKRTRAFIIDFIVMIIVSYLINTFIPPTRMARELQAKSNDLLEKYTSHEINFNSYLKSYGELSYDLASEQKVNNIAYLIFIISYFIILPFIWKGRTLGTFINGIQVERFDKGYLYLHQLFVRNLIVVGIGYLLVANIGVYFIPRSYYFIVISIVGLIQIVLALFSAYMILFTKEKRGLQDLISNTEMTRIIKKK